MKKGNSEFTVCSWCTMKKFPQQCCTCHHDDDLDYMYAYFNANDIINQIMIKRGYIESSGLEFFVSDLKVDREFKNYICKQKQIKKKEHKKLKKERLLKTKSK